MPQRGNRRRAVQPRELPLPGLAGALRTVSDVVDTLWTGVLTLGLTAVAGNRAL